MNAAFLVPSAKNWNEAKTMSVKIAVVPGLLILQAFLLAQAYELLSVPQLFLCIFVQIITAFTASVVLVPMEHRFRERTCC